ncbi:MAG: hypothetical protein JWL73_3107 [Actinomycetia bacterium]|nr:hypothetical protein [Actinomycetes bacterium]
MERYRDFLVAGLALVTGATDAISFLGLGGVFTSVMTGNMVLLGLGAGERHGGLVLRAGLALVGYIGGVGAGSWFAARIGAGAAVWPGRVTVLLLVELVVMLGFSLGWELSAGVPAGASQSVLVVTASLAMGIQGAGIRELGDPGLSTTYLTGTLTTMVSDLARGRRSAASGSDFRILFALVVGAAAGGVLVTQSPRAASVFPLVVLSAVIVLAVALFRERDT